MTKLGLLGDIHSDDRAFATALERLESLGVDRLLCTGDFVGYGWQADEVINRARALDLESVRGNHDRWLLERGQVIGPRGWKPSQLSDDNRDYLENLPTQIRLTVGQLTIEIHHGSPQSDTEFISPYRTLPDELLHYLHEKNVDILVLGHTHVPMIDPQESRLILNPGSVTGIPGVQTSYSFAVLELPRCAVRIHDVRTGREIRRYPVFLDD